MTVHSRTFDLGEAGSFTVTAEFDLFTLPKDTRDGLLALIDDFAEMEARWKSGKPPASSLALDAALAATGPEHR